MSNVGTGGSIRILWDADDAAEVTITGNNLAAFTVGGSAVTFPYTLNSSTTFKTIHNGTYTVSVKHHGIEVAGTPDGTRTVVLENDTSSVFAPSADSTPTPKFLDELSATFVALLGKSNGADDTTWLNTALTNGAGKVLRGNPGENYKISAPLVVHSGTRLDLTGCTVTLLANSNTNILQNAAVTATGTRDNNITIIGGTWDKGANGGTTAHDLHIFRLLHIDGFTIRGATITSTAGKYAVSLADVTDYRCEDLTFNTNSDGVHIDGPARSGVVKNLFGTTGDDLVAVTPQDWTAYDETGGGDVTDLTIEGVYGKDVAQCLVKVLGSPNGAAKNIRISDVRGNCLSQVGAVWIGDDNGQANTTGGFIDNVTLENVSGISSVDTVVSIPGTNLGRIHIRGVHLPSHKKAVYVCPNTAGNCAFLKVEDVTLANGTVAGLPLIQATANITISKMLVDGVEVGAATQNLNLVQFDGTITDLVVTNVTASIVSSSNVVLLNADTSKCQRLTLSNCNLVGTAGELLSAPHSGSTLANLTFTGCSFSGTAWMVDLATTTTVVLSGVKAFNLTNGLFNIRATGNATVRAAALDTNVTAVVKATGGIIRSRDLGFPIDVSLLAKNNGDMAYNANAALSCGAGPVGCDGTAWKNLVSGATY